MSEVVTGPDRDAPGRTRGATARALLWLLGGAVLVVALAVAIAPELLTVPREADQRSVGGMLAVVAVAGVPGVLLVVAALRRPRRRDDDRRDGS